MKREEKIGAYFGISGGVIGLILPTLGFSTWFGVRAGTNITERKYHPILAQLWSALLTLVCTILVHAALMSFVLLDLNYFTIIPMALIMSIYFGSIPILILSAVFGLAFKPILRAQS